MAELERTGGIIKWVVPRRSTEGENSEYFRNKESTYL